MKQFDAIIIGAGPAGGECARALSKIGHNVLLVEKEKDFSARDFSSGGSTLEVLKDFDLPESVVGAYCRKIQIASSDDQHCWKGSEPVALVLDFQKLRTYLAEEITNHQGQVLLGWTYKGHEKKDGVTIVSLKNGSSGVIQTFQTRVLVDATGSERKVLEKGKSKQEAIVGTGIEFLVEVPEHIYQIYAETLAFYIGQKWMPQGYAWIFPMKPNHLKVGVGRNFPQEKAVPHEKSFRYYLDHLIATCLKTSDLLILDQHGKTISYTLRQHDRYFDQNILAIGDAVSTVNPLTFEGIRHALKSGRIAAAQIKRFLNGRSRSFQAYPSEMRRYSGFHWMISERLTLKIYRQADDEKVSLMLQALKRLSLKELKGLVFYYQLNAAMKFYIAYLTLLAKHAFRRSKRRG